MNILYPLAVKVKSFFPLTVKFFFTFSSVAFILSQERVVQAMYDFEPILLRLKKAKADRGLTNEELSQKSGVALGTVNKILSGNTREPKLPAIMALADALGVSVDYLVYGQPEKRGAALAGSLELSVQAQKIGAAYDRATPKVQQLVRLTLEEYLTDAPVRVAASSYGEPVDLSTADPDAPFPGGFNPGQDIP